MTVKKKTVKKKTVVNDVPEVLDLIETYGNMSKPELVNVLYERLAFVVNDVSVGSTQTKRSLNLYTKGKLMALIVDSFYR